MQKYSFCDIIVLMKNKRKTTEQKVDPVDRIKEPEKLSKKWWYWPLFAVVVVLVIGFVILAAWLLSENAKNNPETLLGLLNAKL